MPNFCKQRLSCGALLSALFFLHVLYVHYLIARPGPHHLPADAGAASTLRAAAAASADAGSVASPGPHHLPASGASADAGAASTLRAATAASADAGPAVAALRIELASLRAAAAAELASLRAAAAAEREAGHAAGAAACAAARAAEEEARAEREASCSAVAPFADERQQCDEPGREEVNEFTCVKKGCCWRPGPSYWCFHPPPRVGPRGAVAAAARARPAKMAPRGEGAPPVFAVMAMMKDEHFSLREWLEHYTWQGADVVLLLDNNSTVSVEHVTRDFPIVTVLPAPLRHLQHQYYGSLGREWLEARGVDYVLVVDVDEYFFSDAPGRTLKDLVVEALQGAAVRRAQKLGVPVPITATLYAVLKAWESGPVKT